MRLRRWVVLVEIQPDRIRLISYEPRVAGPFWTRRGATRVRWRLQQEAYGDPRPILFTTVRVENTQTLLDNPPWWAG